MDRYWFIDYSLCKDMLWISCIAKYASNVYINMSCMPHMFTLCSLAPVECKIVTCSGLGWEIVETSFEGITNELVDMGKFIKPICSPELAEWSCSPMESLSSAAIEGNLTLFPGLAHSSLAVQNLPRRPRLVHYMISTTRHVFTSADVCRVAESMYNGVRIWNKSSAYDRLCHKL